MKGVGAGFYLSSSFSFSFKYFMPINLVIFFVHTQLFHIVYIINIDLYSL